MIDQLPMRRGHFLLESGHHGDLWLDLELLCLRPERIRPLVSELAARLQKYGAEVVCGPLVEGAFVGLMVASEMGLSFTYTYPEPPAEEKPGKLYPMRYRLPSPLCAEVHGKRRSPDRAAISPQLERLGDGDIHTRDRRTARPERQPLVVQRIGLAGEHGDVEALRGRTRRPEGARQHHE